MPWSASAVAIPADNKDSGYNSKQEYKPQHEQQHQGEQRMKEQHQHIQL
jgi:hypothetical protein